MPFTVHSSDMFLDPKKATAEAKILVLNSVLEERSIFIPLDVELPLLIAIHSVWKTDISWLTGLLFFEASPHHTCPFPSKWLPLKTLHSNLCTPKLLCAPPRGESLATPLPQDSTNLKTFELDGNPRNILTPGTIVAKKNSHTGHFEGRTIVVKRVGTHRYFLKGDSKLHRRNNLKTLTGTSDNDPKKKDPSPWSLGGQEIMVYKFLPNLF